MLAEPFYVRRVKKIEDPETGEVRLESEADGEVGVARSVQFVTLPDPQSPAGHRLAPILGVCWERSNCPAISPEDPAELHHLDDEEAMEHVVDRLYEDHNEAFVDLVLEKLIAVHGATALAERLFAMEDEESEEEGEEPEEPEESEESEQPEEAAEAQPAH